MRIRHHRTYCVFGMADMDAGQIIAMVVFAAFVIGLGYIGIWLFAIACNAMGVSPR